MTGGNCRVQERRCVGEPFARLRANGRGGFATVDPLFAQSLTAHGLSPTPFGVKHTLFGLRHTPFGLRHTPFELRYTPFGLRHTPFELRYTPFGLSLSKPIHILLRTRQSLNPLPIASNQRLLFRPRPTLDLLLESQCTFTRIEFALPDQLNRFARRGVPNVADLVLQQARLQLVCMASVVGAVPAQQQVDVEGFHAEWVGEGFDKLSPNGAERYPDANP
jgi:hypothetical protein